MDQLGQFEYAISRPTWNADQRRYIEPGKPEPPAHVARSARLVRLTGTAVRYGVLSGVPIRGEAGAEFPEFWEWIAPGAFRRSLERSPVEFWAWRHNPPVLGSTADKRLRVWEDAAGLHFELRVDPQSAAVAELLDRVRSRTACGMSFGFKISDESWISNGGRKVRVVHSGTISHLCPVPRATYPQTEIRIEERGGGIGYSACALANLKRRLELAALE